MPVPEQMVQEFFGGVDHDHSRQDTRVLTPTQTILVIEDNAVTRATLRLALESEPYAVGEAADGASALQWVRDHPPDLILQGLLLPDMDGIELLSRLRHLPHAAAIPVLCCSGVMSKMEEARSLNATFTDYLFKPVEPAQLLQMVRHYLPKPRTVADGFGAHRTLLLVDDDPVQCALHARQLSELGFKVLCAYTGAEALTLAHRTKPDVFVLDLLVPDMTGFELCKAIRRDPLLAMVPIVMTSSAFAVIEQEDRALARRMGANALVVRTPGLQEVEDALRESFAAPHPPPLANDADLLSAEYANRLMRQLKHQSTLNRSFARRMAIDAALLSVTSGAATLVTERVELSHLLQDVLARTLDVGGVSIGIIYVEDGPDRLRVCAHLGVTGAGVDGLTHAFGHEALLRTAMQGGHPVHLPSDTPLEPAGADLLAQIGVPTLLIVPLIAHGHAEGVLILGSAGRYAVNDEWMASIRVIGSQLAQAIALARTVEALTASEAQYRVLFESNPLPMWVFEPAHRALLAVNEAAVRHYGYPREEFLRMTVDQLWPPGMEVPHPPHPISDPVDTPQTVPARHRKKNGDVIDVEQTSTALIFQGQPAYLALVHDVTERKQLERQFLQSQKMEAIGQLAGGVAHDFNNLLTVVKSYGAMLLDDVAMDDPRRESVVEIVGAADRAVILTRQLLAFSRQQVLDPRPLNLNVVVSEMEKMLRRLVPAHIDFRLALASSLGTVTADAGQLEQVVANLVVNARDAMPQGGRLTITTANVDAVNIRTSLPSADPTPHVMLAVTDTGVGMDEGTTRRIFEPFFTTKERGSGTGLGLSTVHGIVKQSGGHIRVDSAIGRGTTFEIYLPQVSMPAVRRASRPPPPIDGGYGSERILLVEDEEAVRRVIVRALTSRGYAVTEACDGHDALAKVEALTEAPDLLISDLMMPKMTGRDLAAALRLRWPALRVLFISGYSEEVAADQQAALSGAAFMEKPFLPGQLAAKVRETLGPRLGAPLDDRRDSL